MSENLKCCPFCGGHDVTVCRTNEESCWVRCDYCNAESESSDSRKGAFENWNRRHYDEAHSDITEDQDKKFKSFKQKTV